MRRNINVTAILLLLTAAACSSVPARNYVAASDTFTEVVQTLTALRSAGKIDDSSFRQITPAIHAANAAFPKWKAAIIATPPGGKVNVPRTVVEAILDAIDQLIIWRAKLEN